MSQSPRLGFFTSFCIFFLFVWVIGLWAQPVGPSLNGWFLLPQVVGGALLFLLMLSLIAGVVLLDEGDLDRSPKEPGAQSDRPPREPEAPRFALTVFFWILVGSLIATVVCGYATLA